MRFLATLLCFLATDLCAQVPAEALRLRPELIREAHMQLGLSAPLAALAAQGEQESTWRTGITAFDGGQGVYQLMPSTEKWLVELDPSLGTPQPFDPVWNIRAAMRLNAHNLANIPGSDMCQRWAGTFKAFNAGLGFVLNAQKKSTAPLIWFGVTEWVNAGQSAANFEASRMYPRWIIYDRQPRFTSFGSTICLSNQK